MDQQLGHEKTITGLLPVLAGTDFIYGPGMIDMGMAVSFEQFLMDAEYIRMFKRTQKPVPTDEDALAVEVIKAVGPAGNYLSQRHTLKHMRDEISVADLIDRRMREAWENDGSKDMPQRARERARDILKNHWPEPLSDDVLKKIQDIIDRETKLLCK
ncbi:MAG: trimethylamine methyltransferase family protein [Firmicutes bacterium]|nr:trimethylamine methyltransferase family protein [Bacillota bacterium]